MRRLDVFLDWGNEKLRVGTLAERDRRILLEYDVAFLNDPLPLSPFKLPLTDGLHEDEGLVFDGLFGVFHDSLPDGWGLLLMDRQLRKWGMVRDQISPLDRLAYIGNRGMGALVYEPARDMDEIGSLGAIELDDLAGQATRILEGSLEDVLPQLIIAGGSPQGARPKVIVGVREEDDHLISGATDLPEGYRHYMIKFGAIEDGPDIGAVEAAYALMARQAGIVMAHTRLFETPDGSRYFGVERFDRNGGRHHIHTLSGLLHASHRHPSVEYDALLRATMVLTRDHRQLIAAFRHMVFNVLAHNRDDHTKNFSFIMARDGTWTRTPAYDLVFSYGMGGWHTMAVAGEAQRPRVKHLLDAGAAAGVGREEGHSVIQEVTAAVADWPSFANEMGVSHDRTRAIGQELARLRA